MVKQSLKMFIVYFIIDNVIIIYVCGCNSMLPMIIVFKVSAISRVNTMEYHTPVTSHHIPYSAERYILTLRYIPQNIIFR